LFFELAAARGVQLDGESLPVVEEICRRLDGLPLAIELVTARLVLLGPAQLLTALDDGLALAMEGSCRLPGTAADAARDARLELRALTEDSGSCTASSRSSPAAARSKTRWPSPGRAGVLADLEASSRRTCFGARPATASCGCRCSKPCARTQSDASLRPGRSTSAGAATRSTFSGSRSGPRKGLRRGAADWLDRVEDELGQRRAALDWCLASGRAAEALEAVSALGRFWRAHGHASEARRVLARGLDDPADLPADVRARALWTAAHEAMAQSDYPAAIPALEEALSLFRELGDSRHAVFALCEIARALSSRDELDQRPRGGAERARALRRAAATTGRAPQLSTRSPWSRATANDTSSPRSTASGASRCAGHSATRS
jgi:tetratricopeptide (TPR) repeat protein